MRKKFICRIAVLLILTMVMSVFIGCTQRSDTTTTTTTTKTTTASSATTATSGTETEPEYEVKPVTLSLWIHGGYTGHVGRWGRDPVSEYIKEKTGVSFDIQTGDGSNDGTRLNLMITSNQMPDIIIVPKLDPMSFTLQIEGVVEDIDQLARQHNASTIIRIIEETDDINLKYNRFKDGNYWGGKDAPLYVWPDYFVDKYTYENNRLDTIQERDCWIARKDIYEDMGSPDLSNIDDFTQFLKDVRDHGYNDVNGNPIKVMGLIQGNTVDVFAATFTGNDETITRLGDGSVVNNFELPEYKDAIMYLNMLYREGILDQEIYTQTYDQWRDKMVAGGVGIMNVWYWHVDGANIELEPHGLTYWAIDGDKSPRGPGVDKVIMNQGWAIGVGFGWRSTFISTTCSDKAAAINFLNFMYGHEGQMLAWYGMPGENFEPAEAWQEDNLLKLQNKELSVKNTEEGIARRKELGVDFGKEQGVNYWTLWNIHGYADFVGGAGDTVSQTPYTLYAREQVLKLSEYDFEWSKFQDVRPLTMAEPDTKAIGDAITQIKTKWLPQIIMAGSADEASTNYDKMLDEMRVAGLEDLNAAFNEVYENKMLPLMG